LKRNQKFAAHLNPHPLLPHPVQSILQPLYHPFWGPGRGTFRRRPRCADGVTAGGKLRGSAPNPAFLAAWTTGETAATRFDIVRYYRTQ
jgi:hypothetical protein